MGVKFDTDLSTLDKAWVVIFQQPKKKKKKHFTKLL